MISCRISKETTQKVSIQLRLESITIEFKIGADYFWPLAAGGLAPPLGGFGFFSNLGNDLACSLASIQFNSLRSRQRNKKDFSSHI